MSVVERSSSLRRIVTGKGIERRAAEMDLDDVFARGLSHADTVDGDVENICAVEEGPPEPAEILTGHVFDRPEKVGGCRVLERPAASVLAHRAVHDVAANDGGAQREQHRAGLAIGHRAKGVGIDAVSGAS